MSPEERIRRRFKDLTGSPEEMVGMNFKKDYKETLQDNIDMKEERFKQAAKRMENI